MTPDIELVVHCWRYSRLLTYQLSALVLHPPQRARVRAVVFYSQEDRRTCELLQQPRVQSFLYSFEQSSIEIFAWPLETASLLRRAIGRNAAAKASTAPIVWFADCDMPIRGETFDWLVENWPDDAALCYPRHVGKCTHAHGDELIEAVAGHQFYDIDTTDFPAARQRRAIGGTQIVRGALAREHGYLDPGHPKNTERQALRLAKRYHKPQERWRRTTEDPSYRGWLQHVSGERVGRGHALDVPGVYRIRHSKYGRKDEGVEL